jgi:NADPH:quinone reductase-like Zn-dependent oxidoreductase
VPKPDELLVRVHAAGLNPIDNMIPTGNFKPVLKFKLPATLGSDLAGVVMEVGSRVTRFKPGDAVFASVFDLGTGAIAEFAVVPERAAARKPANLDFVQAASIPMVGLTSWQALKERAQLLAGQEEALAYLAQGRSRGKVVIDAGAMESLRACIA